MQEECRALHKSPALRRPELFSAGRQIGDTRLQEAKDPTCQGNLLMGVMRGQAEARPEEAAAASDHTAALPVTAAAGRVNQGPEQQETAEVTTAAEGLIHNNSNSREG